MDNPKQQRTIGFHPCVGKKASGEERPTSVVIRMPDGKHAVHEFDEQQLLDFITCGAAVAWRDATLADLSVARPPHHLRWAETDEQAYGAYAATDSNVRDAERDQLFRVKRKKSTGEVVGYLRLQVASELVALDPKSDIVGVANGGLGFQIMEILLARYPDLQLFVIGSGTLKERRPEFDALLPATIRRKAEKLRAVASASESAAAPEVDGEADGAEEEEAEPSKSAAKDANAKFDAHRIAYALADETTAKLFHRCTMRDRDWAAVNIAYGRLEVARKARVAAEQQFRQIHRAELRRLVQDPRVPHVTLSVSGEDGDEKQTIESLLVTYEATLRICVTSDKAVAKKLEVLRQAHTRIEGARTNEAEMERHLETALDALPEYTEFLIAAKAKVDSASGLPLGKYIGGRIFGRWIAGFGSPMSSRINEPVRSTDTERIAACRVALTAAIAALDRTGLPAQPTSGGGKTREWLLACERIVSGRVASAESDDRVRLELQLAQVRACRNAYRALTNAKKCAANRPLNRVIAYMGLHVKQGGKYADVKKEFQFPRRRKGGRANWNEQLLRQGAYQWAALIIKGGDSYWKAHVFQPYKDRLIAGGMAKGHANNRAIWRMTTVAMRWLITEWFAWERRRAKAEPQPVEQAA
ncbi:hypothetical protein HY635_00135 [Candidatus Uhrbacteria bacterium]|nr:hypothetical protein [Candidatus Uhrbacteria bacterium]